MAARKSLGSSAQPIIPAFAQSDLLDQLRHGQNINQTVARFQVGDTVLDCDGDPVQIREAYGLHSVGDTAGTDMRWGYVIQAEGHNYFERAGNLWCTDDLKPSWLRLVATGKAVQ